MRLQRWKLRDKGSNWDSGEKYVGKDGDKDSKGTCGDNDTIIKGDDKSRGDDGTGELGEGERYQCICNGYWSAVSMEGV